MSQANLWELADLFEDRAKDRNTFGPLQRMVWAAAHQALVERLGERNV
ncbi:MAG: hypothetical protein ACKODT_07130 [Fluviibacter sp.]